MKKKSIALLLLLLLAVPHYAFSFYMPGKVQLTSGKTVTFSNIKIRSIDDYDTHMKIKEFDKIKRIELLEPGKKYDGTKGGIGVIKITKRNNQVFMINRGQITAHGHGAASIIIQAKNPITEAIEERYIGNSQIQYIEFE